MQSESPGTGSFYGTAELQAKDTQLCPLNSSAKATSSTQHTAGDNNLKLKMCTISFFPAAFYFCYCLRPFWRAPFQFLMLCPCSLGGSGERWAGAWSISRGWAAMRKRAVPSSAGDALGQGFTLSCSAHFGLFSSGCKTESGTSFTLLIANIEFLVAKWCRALGPLPFFFFFLPSPWTQLLTQEEVGYAVTHSIKRPNKSSS